MKKTAILDNPISIKSSRREILRLQPILPKPSHHFFILTSFDNAEGSWSVKKRGEPAAINISRRRKRKEEGIEKGATKERISCGILRSNENEKRESQQRDECGVLHLVAARIHANSSRIMYIPERGQDIYSLIFRL